jgi:putative glutathione S-transferase
LPPLQHLLSLQHTTASSRRLLRPLSFLPRRAMTTRGTWATSEKGSFVRDPSKFRNWIEADPSAEFPAVRDRYHLYISLACPWAHRTLATVYLKGLQDVIGVSVVHPVFQRTRPDDPNDTHMSWAFVDPATTPSLPGPSGLGAYSSDGAIPDTINHAKYVRDLYELCSEGNTRYTVPVLWDKQKKTIVSNESADIVRMLNTAFEGLVPSKIDLYPQELRGEIDAINEWVYNDINNGVYKCGFCSTQAAYDEAVTNLFNSLDRVEAILGKHRFLVGNSFTEADLRLFTTLIRFDEVYFVHFKTNKRMIKEYPNLFNYTKEIYQFPPVTKSVNMQHIKLHYYGSHTHLNAFGVVPVGPGTDFSAKHDRDRFTDAKVPEFP